jgi:signal transduction histidine kinase
MRHTVDRHRRAGFRGFLRDEAVLVALLGAMFAGLLSGSRLRVSYDVPDLLLVLTTIFALAAGLVALLSAIRFSVERRHFDLLLSGGFFTISVSLLVVTVGAAVTSDALSRNETAPAAATAILGWALLAASPHVHGRAGHSRVELWAFLGALVLAIGAAAFAARVAADIPGAIESMRGMLSLVVAAAVVGFANRFRIHGEDLDRWLAFAATLMLFASLDDLLTPIDGGSHLSQAAFLLLVGYGVLLVGVWRAILSSEFGRAVAEERGRVAREIHDGLAQYLFAVSTHAALLESGADPAETLPRLKQAAIAAQREARFAVLALSSAAGTAPFDAALRRYVDVLTADGALDVELEVDSGMRLAPDEQIEIFRIVQEGLANARRHAGAGHAWVLVARRGADRLVTVSDDGTGFDVADGETTGQGLKNMRARAATIGGALTLASTPGRGTALEVVLRPG